MGWWNIVAGIGAGLQSTVGAAAGINQMVLDHKNYQHQLRNYEMQQGLIDWNKAVQEQNWIREDTAVQRRVADMKAAGLNPVLAAGQGAPSTWHPVANHPPPPRHEHNSPQYFAMMADALGKFAQIAHTRAQTKLLYKQADKVESDIALTERQTLHIDTQEGKIIHDMAMDRASYILGVSRHLLEGERFRFEESHRGKQLQLEMDKFNFSKTTQEFYMGLAMLDHALKERGVEVEEREIALQELVREFALEVQRRDVTLEELMGLRHGETPSPLLRPLYNIIQGAINLGNLIHRRVTGDNFGQIGGKY